MKGGRQAGGQAGGRADRAGLSEREGDESETLCERGGQMHARMARTVGPWRGATLVRSVRVRLTDRMGRIAQVPLPPTPPPPQPPILSLSLAPSLQLQLPPSFTLLLPPFPPILSHHVGTGTHSPIIQ